MIAIATATIQTFVFNGIIVLIFIVLARLLLGRNQNKLSVSLALYFITVSIGLIVNMIYRGVDVYGVNIILNKVTIYFTALAGINLLNFNMLLFYSTKIYTRKKQLIIALIYAVILAVLFLIPGGVEWQYDSGTTVRDFGNPDDTGVPVYSLLFGLYGLIVSQLIFLGIYFLAGKIRKKMGHNIYSKKYFRNIIGISLFNIQLILAFLGHMLNIEPLRIVIAISTILLIIPGAFLLYFGLKKEPEV